MPIIARVYMRVLEDNIDDRLYVFTNNIIK